MSEKEQSVINPDHRQAVRYINENQNELISKGYGTIKAEELYEAIRAPKRTPRPGRLSYRDGNQQL